MKWQSTKTWKTTYRGLRIEVHQPSPDGKYFWSVLQKELDFGFGDTARWINEVSGIEDKLTTAKRAAEKAAREFMR